MIRMPQEANFHFAQDKVRDQGSLAAKNLLRGHPFTNQVYTWLLSSLSDVGFNEVPTLTRTWLNELWGSLLNSKLIEDANKLQRDEEQRGSTSKKVPRMQGWHCITQHKLFEKYHRKELPNDMQVGTPGDFSFNDLFQYKKKREPNEAEKKDFDFVKEITKDKVWPSMTPMSEQEKLAAFAMLMKVCSGSAHGIDWALVEKAWLAGLLPAGQVLSVRGALAFVVSSFHNAALVWPGHRGADDSFKFDTSIASLNWFFLFDVEEVSVCSVKPRCPLAMQGTSSGTAGVVLQMSAQTALLDWHKEHGFPGVREDCLRQLSRHLGVPVVPMGTGSDDEEVHLAVCLLVHMDQTLTEKEVIEFALHRGTLQVQSLEATEAEITEAIQDTMLAAEQRKALWQHVIL